MTISLLASLGLKSAAIALLTLALLYLLRQRPAAERSFLAHAGLIAVLLTPLAVAVLPPLEFEVLAASAAPALTPAAIAAPPAPPESGLSAAHMIWTVYVTVAALLGAALVVALARLRLLRGRARPVTDRAWLDALQNSRSGPFGWPQLLVSDAITAPISWGLIRPVIVIDRATLEAPAMAQPVILHELAHIDSHDWLKLVIERTATAIFWFNPLVWALAHHGRSICERAADDAVLRGPIAPVDYAMLLVEAARRDCAVPPGLANGIAPNAGTLEERIAKVLDKTLDRRPLGKAALAGLCVLSLGVHAPVAAIVLTSAAASPAPLAPARAAPVAAAPVAALEAGHAVAAAQPAINSIVRDGELVSRNGMIIQRDPVSGRMITRPATPAERAALAEAKAQLERAAPQMEAARAQLERARPQLEAARIDLERARPQMEAARRDLEEARPAIAEAMRAVELARPAIERSRVDVERVRIELERARPALAASQARLEKLRQAMARGEPLNARVLGPDESLQVLPNGNVVIQRDR